MITSKVNLKKYNTFGIEVYAKRFGKFSNIHELKEILSKKNNEPILTVGGGSNLLFTKNFEGLVIKNEIKGFEIVAEDDEYTLVKSGAGEVWHEFVLNCLKNNLGGIENLSLIPGSVGASPMQNIGAYGIEIKDVFHELEAFQISTGELQLFNKEQCEFGYRESIFKKDLKEQYIITSVTFRLTKKHKLNSTYGAINNQLTEMGISQPTIHDISKAVIAIRSSKLPDPSEIGNAGSFFKNPVVDKELFKQLLNEFKNIPNYPLKDGNVKLAAGWLIEQAGWKGKTFGNYGVHKNQALVLVNYGGATGKDIIELAQLIIEDVRNKFGLTLEREVNVI